MADQYPNMETLAGFGAFEPKTNPIIYHYCSTESFLAITQNKCLRLSDINTMNDFSESHWGYDRFVEAVNTDLEKYDREYFDDLDEVISGMQLHLLPALSCFSFDGDVLSQWRAYADDGAGIALGLDSDLIGNLAVQCSKVVYDQPEQVEQFRHIMAILYPMWQAGKTTPEAKKEFLDFATVEASKTWIMKNPAFIEEQEVRIVRALLPEEKNGQWSLKDAGGEGEDKVSSEPLDVKFRARGSGVVSYVDVPISGLGNELVKEIVIGPRSVNSGSEISMALSACGFRGFTIRTSKATYRNHA